VKPWGVISGRISAGRGCILPGLLFSTESLAGQSLSSYVRTDSPEAVIEIRAAEKSAFRIPRTVYGIYMENLGNTIFRGVAAQLLENPSLETYHASLQTLNSRFSGPEFQNSLNVELPLPWLPLRMSGNRYEARFGDAANSDRYVYLIGLPPPQPGSAPPDYPDDEPWLLRRWFSMPATQEIGIRQSIDLPIQRETEYHGSLFASSAEGPVSLTVSFRKRNDPDAILASTEIEVPGSGSRAKIPFELTLPDGAVQPLEEVDFAVSLTGSHRVSVDMIQLFPADAVEGYFDPEVIAAVRDLDVSLIRWGGNFMSAYHWEDGVGPRDERRTLLNRSWGNMEYNDFGTDEFLAFTRLVGARPMICLNLGSGTVEEARAWVQYVQGAATTPQGARRAANGHQEPYADVIWELGNELWGPFQEGWQTPEGNARRYLEFYPAVREQAPPGTMIVANGGDADFALQWNEPLIREAGEQLSSLAMHLVIRFNQLVARQADTDTRNGIALATPIGMANLLRPVREQIDANPATRGRVGLAYTEWSFSSGGAGWTAPDSQTPTSGNLGGALIGAGWMNMLLSHADFIQISSMSSLMGGGGVRKRQGQVWESPQYWVFWLYSQRAGDTVVGSKTEVRNYDVHDGQIRMPEIPNVPYLDVLATENSSNGEVVLFVVNRDWRNTIPVTLRIQDFSPASEARVETLTGHSLVAENTLDRQDAVRPVTSTVAVSGNQIRHVFPEHSLTVITIRPR